MSANSPMVRFDLATGKSPSLGGVVPTSLILVDLFSTARIATQQRIAETMARGVKVGGCHRLQKMKR
jgi:hypothetical protein